MGICGVGLQLLSCALPAICQEVSQLVKHRENIPISPSLAQSEPSTEVSGSDGIDRRIVWVSAVACAIGPVAALVAVVLIHLINLFTQVFFFGTFSLDEASPAHHSLGAWVVAIPVIGGLIIGVMARWGAKSIRGHGIPEAMEQILLNQSRIPARITLLKPLSSAISIGSGGPFGAEGPIIATGGALGSMLGQVMRVTAMERKTLLAAGASAGMTAIFSAPIAAVLLAVELLLFEFRGRSLVPVALATVSAAVTRYLLLGSEPVFAMPYIAVSAGEIPFMPCSESCSGLSVY